MGNRSNCSMFYEDDQYDSYFIDGLTPDENKVIKQIYRSMDIGSKNCFDSNL
jgi:hypothetical protein